MNTIQKWVIQKAINRYLEKNKAMIEKLKSRKFWAAIGAGVVLVFSNQLGLSEDITSWITKLVMTYIGSQAVVDAVAAKSK